jgi:hypothetical protein
VARSNQCASSMPMSIGRSADRSVVHPPPTAALRPSGRRRDQRPGDLPQVMRRPGQHHLIVHKGRSFRSTDQHQLRLALSAVSAAAGRRMSVVVARIGNSSGRAPPLPTLSPAAGWPVRAGRPGRVARLAPGSGQVPRLERASARVAGPATGVRSATRALD